MTRTLTALLSAAVLAVAGCGGDDDEPANDGAQQAEEQPAESRGPCKDIEQPPARDDGGQKRPAGKLDPDKTYEVVFATSCGDFTLRVNQKASPNAAASFVELARNGFYDDTIFHRIVPGFVIQAGDPTVTGAGGAGYETRDRVPPGTTYEPGVAAMAKAGNEPAGTGGSQFFVVTGDGGGLAPDYALLGRVVDGMDVVRAIGEFGDPASGSTGTPLQSIAIEKATVRER